jgi:hypothetical protein
MSRFARESVRDCYRQKRSLLCDNAVKPRVRLAPGGGLVIRSLRRSRSGLATPFANDLTASQMRFDCYRLRVSRANACGGLRGFASLSMARNVRAPRSAPASSSSSASRSATGEVKPDFSKFS